MFIMTSGFIDIERESLQVQVDLFKQMKHHLQFMMDKYHQQGKKELAKMICDSFSDSSCHYDD
jgi:hypothetical protein